MNLFIIPGNPPAAHFYQLWADEIQIEHPGSSVYISSYPNLPFTKESSQYLKETAAIHGQKLSEFQKTVDKKVTVVGHSLGGWMALHLLKEHDAIIENCLLLYPFLRRPSFKGRAILQTVGILYQIPFLKKFLFKHRSKLEKFSEDLKFVTDEELHLSLALNYHENRVIARSKEIPPISSEKLHMIYCDHDKWCPQDVIHELKQKISCQKSEAGHGFITTARERAALLKSLLGKVFSNHLSA